MKLNRALLVFFVSLGLAIFAFFYNPPTMMQQAMLRAVAREQVWSVRAEGTLEHGELYLDLLKRADGVQAVRIAYPPLKLLNNQWIEIHNSSAHSLFGHFILTKRLTTFKDLWRRVEHFEFAFNAPQFVQGTGTVWINSRTRLPISATMEVARAIPPATLHLAFAYQDTTGGLPLNVRPLQEVLAQLEEVAKARNGKPKKLLQLGEARTAPEAFENDFDHDGLSDALELFYGTDPANPDTDNDTHLDGVEVEQGYDPAGEGRLKSE